MGFNSGFKGLKAGWTDIAIVREAQKDCKCKWNFNADYHTTYEAFKGI